MKRVVFHLGLPRTGTTSIQSFLAENRERLLAHRILYPTPSGARIQHPTFGREALNPDAATTVNHVALAMELLDATYIPPDGGGPPEWRAALDRMVAEDLETLVVSYENFGLTPRRYDLSRPGPRLNDFERVGIVYLRHPQDWLVSLYEQSIRGKGRASTTFAQFRHFDPVGKFTSSRRLRVIEQSFRLDRLVPIDFGAVAVNNGLIPSFLAAAGLADAVSPGDDVHRNASLSTWQNLFLRHCNRRGLSDEAFLWVRRVLTHTNRAGTPLVDLAPGLDMVAPGEREELARVAAADVADLGAKIGMILKGPKPPPVAEYRPFVDADFRQVVAALHEPRAVRPIPPEIAAEFARLAS